MAAGAAATLGAHLTAPQLMLSRASVFAAGCMACACAVANVVNDVADVNVDAVSKEDRPIPAGRVSRSVAMWIAVVLSAATLALAYPLGRLNLLFATLILGFGIAYSYLVKGRLVTLSSVVVAFVASSSVPFGSSAVGAVDIAVSYAYFSVFLFMLSYDLLKTIIDLDGDAQAGLRTLPVTMGREKSFLLFRVAAGAFILATLLGVALSNSPATYAYRILATAITPVSFAIILTLKRGYSNARIAAKILWVAWLPGLWALGSLR
ncbi:UbiA family prenyltransferase [Kitasatospora aureofaciens]|uniref:UbiA family prenyltransferase n=1 Tax=Kitasatospora aureofaciens TaxID=1894 RepID=UPI0034089F85